MDSEFQRDITSLLAAHGAADDAALGAAIGSVYKDLQRLARSMMRRERSDHTLQPTALVHEALDRLWQQRPDSLKNRGQLIGLASLWMRRILVDAARARGAQKRGDGIRPEQLTDGPAATFDLAITLDVDAALKRLEQEDARAAKVVEMRWFGGFTVDEVAEALGISAPTVKRDLTFASAFLRTLLPETG